MEDDRSSSWYLSKVVSEQCNLKIESENLCYAKKIATSPSHTCAIMTSGGVKCGGSNEYGELGNESTYPFYSGIPVDVENLDYDVKDIAVGVDHTCAIESSGIVKCWGGNASGELGKGTSLGNWEMEHLLVALLPSMFYGMSQT